MEGEDAAGDRGQEEGEAQAEGGWGQQGDKEAGAGGAWDPGTATSWCIICQKDGCIWARLEVEPWLCVPPGAAAGGGFHPGGEESEESPQPAPGVEHDGV